jgi:hypothetical protein
LTADIVIGHIGDKPVGIAAWIVLIWLAFMAVAFLLSLFSD